MMTDPLTFITLFRREAVRWADREECEVRCKTGRRCARIGQRIIPQPPLPNGRPQYGRVVCMNHYHIHQKATSHGT